METNTLTENGVSTTKGLGGNVYKMLFRSV